MKTKKILISLFCLISLFTFSFQTNVYLNNGRDFELISLKNSNNNSWFRIWKGSTYSEGENIVLDSKENIIIHGRYGNGNTIVKYNNSGEQLWNQSYGDIWNFIEFRIGEDIAVDSEDNIFLVGWVAGEMNWIPNCFLVKFNESGEIQWAHDWGSIEKCVIGSNVAIDSEDNIYVAGFINESTDRAYDIFLLKYNQSGDLQWSQLWDGFGWEAVSDIEIDELNNIYMSGITNGTSNNYDVLMLKYNSSGILQWNRTWGGDFNDIPYKIAFDSQDRIVMWGCTESFGEKKNLIMKVNSSGNLIWNKTLNGELYYDFDLDSVDNLYFVRTEEFSASEDTDIYLAMYNNTGSFVSDLIWGTNNNETLGEIVLDSSDNIYFVGTSSYNMFLVKNTEDLFPPGLFKLTSNVSSIEKNSVLYFNWTDSRGVKNYSVFIDTNPINNLDGAILIKGGLKETEYYLSSFSEGKYYYVVAAYNKNGYTLSNYIYIVVIGDEIISFGIMSLIFSTVGIIYIILSMRPKIKE